MEIKLEDITKRQQQILDDIWDCDSREDLAKYISSLNDSDRLEADGLITMLEQEVAVHYWLEDNQITLAEGGEQILAHIVL